MKNKHTPGPWVSKRLANYSDPGHVILWPDKGGTHMRRLDYQGNFTELDADLIAESGTIHHETGLTPRKLLEQRDDLQAALKIAVTQNEHDMLMTGDELRKARAAIDKVAGEEK